MPRWRLRGSSSTSRATSPQAPAHPDAERHGESHLLARQDLGRQNVAHRFAQDPLRREPAQLHPRRQRARRTRRDGDRGRARGSRSTPPCSSGPASSAARRDRSSCRCRAGGRASCCGRSARRNTRATRRTRAPAVACAANARREERRLPPEPDRGEVVEEHRLGRPRHRRGTIASHSGRAAPGSRGTTRSAIHVAQRRGHQRRRPRPPAS